MKLNEIKSKFVDWIIKHRKSLLISMYILLAGIFITIGYFVYINDIRPAYYIRLQEKSIEEAYDDLSKADTLFMTSYEEFYNYYFLKDKWFKVLRKAAEEDYSNAQLTLGLIYQGLYGYLGERIKIGYISVFWGKRYPLNHPEKEVDLGICDETCSYDRAAYWYKRSADNGNAEAAARLGYLYLYGVGVEKNKFKGQNYILSSAKKGNVLGLRKMGDLCYKGKYGMSLSFNDDGTTDMAEIYQTQPDIESAKFYWRKAADLGDKTALEHLEKIYE